MANQYMPKIFHGPTKTLRPPTYTFNVRSVTKHLLDLIQIIVMYSMTTLLIILSTKKWNQFSIMPEQQSQELFEVRWSRKLCHFHKVFKNEHRKCLFHLIPVRCTSYTTRTESNIPLIKTKHSFFKNSFFLSAIFEWNNLDPSISVFKEKIFNFIRPSPNSVFDIHHPKGIKLITRLRLGLSHLTEQKFKHSFQDTINPLCNCGQDIESATHFFLHCPFLVNERGTPQHYTQP